MAADGQAAGGKKNGLYTITIYVRRSASNRPWGMGAIWSIVVGDGGVWGNGVTQRSSWAGCGYARAKSSGRASRKTVENRPARHSQSLAPPLLLSCIPDSTIGKTLNCPPRPLHPLALPHTHTHMLIAHFSSALHHLKKLSPPLHYPRLSWLPIPSHRLHLLVYSLSSPLATTTSSSAVLRA